MQVRFVRTRGAADRIYVTRSDGSAVSWSFPNFGEGLPHDLVHLILETHFGLRAGFWGRVDRGIDPAKINADANRSGGKDKYRGFGEDLTELFLAEALAGLAWFVEGLSDEDRLATLRESEPETAEKLDAAALGQAGRKLAAAQKSWRELPDKGHLDFEFPAQ
jgi:hypothetical protein